MSFQFTTTAIALSSRQECVMCDRDDSNHSNDPTLRSGPPKLPDLYMPAMPPLGLIRALRRTLRGWRQRRQIRRLLAEDDAVLADLGYRRAVLQRALGSPVPSDALNETRVGEVRR